MAVETIQCPKCGSPLEVTSGTRLAECTYCGSTLRITVGASGHPLGVLEGIKEDTSLMAKERALEVVRQRIARLEEERAALEGEQQVWREAAVAPTQERLRLEDQLWNDLPADERSRHNMPRWSWGLAGVAVVAVVAGAIALAAGSGQICGASLGLLLVSTAVVGALFSRSDNQRTLVKQGLLQKHLQTTDAYASRITALTMEIKKARAREERLREEIDRQAMEL